MSDPIAAMDVEPSLLAEVQERFNVGPRYAEAYLSYRFQNPETRPAALEEILALPSPLPMWFEYALTTNWRGERILELLKPEIPTGARRYLDVGCGFGGCLVAFARAGFEVCGIELERDRVVLAAANCRDHGLRDCIHEASLLDTSLPDSLGRFDVITMVDVIEHVEDIPGALEKAVALLRPGGVLLLEIPNKDYVGAVASDGHFGLFGITQLDRPEAMEYHRRFFDFRYDVDYFELGHYRSLLAGLGCTSKLIPATCHASRRLREVPSLMRDSLRAWWAYRKNHAQKLTPELRRTIGRRYARYLAGISRSFAAVTVRSTTAPAFKEKYLLEFWTLIAKREGELVPIESKHVLQPKPHAAPEVEVKHTAEMTFWRGWLGEHGLGARSDYYRDFMMNMGGLADKSFFDGLICLDIGCGPMGSLTWLDNARAALGLDPLADEYMEFDIAGHRMLYLKADAEEIPLPTGYVDVVFSMNSLDHVDDVPAACREIRRVLRRGGWFIASLNLNEPPTPTEPWMLTEEFLEKHLFHGWLREFYRVRPKIEHDGGDPYRYFFQECPKEIEEAGGPQALWCRFRVP